MKVWWSRIKDRVTGTQLKYFFGGVGVLFIALMAWRFWPLSDAEAAIEHSVVAIQVTSQRGDWYSPWQLAEPDRASGSGFLISGGLVLTNAHVVADARQIFLIKDNASMPFAARVKFIAHDCDLALLEPQDKAFFEGMKPLPLGELPSLRTAVRTYGFPVGGEKLSRTAGVVSRVEFNTYVHSGIDAHLTIQTDSAINPGNSGGPVMQNGKVVGVAFQNNASLSGMGYFIPTPVVRRFLQDVADDHYDGFGELGVVTSNMLNPAYRQYLGIPNPETGVVVNRLYPGSTADGQLHPEDVILSVEGAKVDNDGTIPYHGYQVDFAQAVEEKQVGDPVDVVIWRNKTQRKLRLVLKPLPDADRVRNRFDVAPHYFVYAGLVFMPLDLELLHNFGNYMEDAPKSLLKAHFQDPVDHPEQARAGRVVLSRVLPHPINTAYQSMVNQVVSTINGQPIHTLDDIPKALAAAKEGYHVIGFADTDGVLVMDRRRADHANPDIQARYGIREDRRFQ